MIFELEFLRAVMGFFFSEKASHHHQIVDTSQDLVSRLQQPGICQAVLVAIQLATLSRSQLALA